MEYFCQVCHGVLASCTTMYCQVSKVQTMSVHDSTPRKGPLSFSNLLSFRVCLHCRHVWHICNPSATVSPIQTKLTSFQEPWDTTTTAHTHTHTHTHFDKTYSTFCAKFMIMNVPLVTKQTPLTKQKVNSSNQS